MKLFGNLVWSCLVGVGVDQVLCRCITGNSQVCITVFNTTKVMQSYIKLWLYTICGVVCSSGAAMKKIVARFCLCFCLNVLRCCCCDCRVIVNDCCVAKYEFWYWALGQPRAIKRSFVLWGPTNVLISCAKGDKSSLKKLIKD